MTPDEHDFRIRPGRIKDVSASSARPKLFGAQVLEAAVRAGHRGRSFGGGSGVGRSVVGRGRGAGLAASLRSPSRRVIVQARVVRQFGSAFRSAPLSQHIAYLNREGVDREGGRGVLFDASGEADGRAFAERCEGDRHHFRFMVSPEDASQLADLKQTIRELMSQAERDLDTRLDWVAAEHWNTAHPHVHVLVRGRTDRGEDLVISRDYISRGLKDRAERLVSLELGPRTDREIAEDLQRQMGAERWTRLDELLVRLSKDHRIDLRPGEDAPDPRIRPLLLGRAATLERLGYAEPDGVGVWRLDEALKPRLRELGERGDIIGRLHRAMGQHRAMAELAPFGEASEAPILGRLVERGLADEQAGSAYVILDGIDGRAHHVRLPDLAAAGDTPVGGIVELRPERAGRPAQLVHRSDLSLEQQVRAEGATWLDRQLVADQPARRAATGFGAEVEAALTHRREQLQALGLARRRGGDWTFDKGLLSELRGREVAAAGQRLAERSGIAFRGEVDDPRVRGTYRERLDLASGRFALIEDELGFRLVPWARVIQPSLGREVSGLVRDGLIEWEIGRTRGLSR